MGINEFAWDELHKEKAESSLQLPASANDARVMAELMAARCGVTEKLVLVDREATRAAIQAAVCDWLPKHTRPGDVAIFFMSSHGSQTIDDDGDEPDGKDEWLLPHDVVTAAASVEMMERDKAGRLDGAARPAFDRLVAEMRRAVEARRLDPSNNENISRFLAHRTGITDDQFGHWLQRLSGRRVVVILDTCHSGGFAAGEKALPVAAAPEEFDFLDAELGRLKDLGQPDSSMISACGAQQLAAAVRFSDTFLSQIEQPERFAADGKSVMLGVLAYEIGTAVTTTPGITLADTFDRCREGAARYFERYNAIRRKEGKEPAKPQEPRFYDFSKRPLVLSIEAN